MRAEEFFSFMVERESIRLRRNAGESPPWTDDPILQKYKFTNVKREHDRTSRLLRAEFYTPNRAASKEEILLNCAIARYFGTIEFMRAVGWQRAFVPRLLRNVANERARKGQRVFTGAYVITNAGIPGNKIDVVIDRFLADLWAQRKDIIGIAEASGSWCAAHERLMQVFGFAGTGFMSKETLLDTFYTDFWPKNRPVDRNAWTPVGPGSMRGAARVLETAKASAAQTLDVCRRLFLIHELYWPKDFVKLELTDIQFQLCEFSKYEKVRLGEGRPRSLFVPTSEEK